MEGIYIEPATERELEILKSIAKLIGAKAHVLSEKESKYLAGLKMIEIAESLPKYEITDDEIMNLMKEAEEEIYGKPKK
ncbi:MAG: hypothetical protein K2Q24_16420 [Chitinophagaceae bacterium]|jgi:ribosome biogenesis SPOUT family RNA methylase Rps3|nr:hypothetical protein [Chitinophagaceae bacterium]